MLHVEYIINTIFNSRTYILSEKDSNEVWLVDCGDVEKLPKDVNVKGVLLTHVHCDHIYGLNKLFESNPECVVYTNEFGKESLQNPRLNMSKYHDDAEPFIFAHPEKVVVLHEGDTFPLWNNEIQGLAIETPGHDPSCLCYEIGDNLFTGDSYIPGVKIPITFRKSNKQQAQESLDRILQIVEKRGLNICPGHEVEVFLL